MPWICLTPAFARLRLIAAQSVACSALIFVLVGMVSCGRGEPAPTSVELARQAAPEIAEPVAHSPESFRADVERLVSAGDYDGAVRLLKGASVERQVEHDAAGYLAVAEDMIVLPGVPADVEYDRDRDWVLPGTSDVIENTAWQKAATEFAGRYNALRANQPAEAEAAPAEADDSPIHLAFILLSKAQLPEGEAVAQAFREFAAPDETIQVEADASADDPEDRGLSLKLGTGEEGMVVVMPMAIPGGEAEQYAMFSLSTIGKGWEPPPYNAHLVVMLYASGKTSPAERIARFTSVLAAVTKASPAVGVYWGSAGATHDSEFFTSVAADHDMRMLIWSGVSVARQEDGRLSLLSTGMEQFGLPNLLLISGETPAGEALPFMYDLLSYVVTRGEAVPEGDTVGWTEEQRLPVRYVESPVDPEKKVFCVELP